MSSMRIFGDFGMLRMCKLGGECISLIFKYLETQTPVRSAGRSKEISHIVLFIHQSKSIRNIYEGVKN